jgi:EAL and modified HD-GYP domain-containing signal transduction protein
MPAASTMLRREEMMDDAGRLAGYRFSVYLEGALPAPVASARLFHALQAGQVASLGQRRAAVISLPPALWDEDVFKPLIAAHTVFHVLTPASAASSPDLAHTLKAIRATGAGVALSCPAEIDSLAAALPLATHVFVPFNSEAIEPFERQVQALRQRHPHLKLIAEQVSSWPERRLCVAQGMAYVMGDFLSSVEERDRKEKINDSRIVLTEMLNLIRNDGDAQAIADVAKRDPGVAVHVLAMANSPAYGVMKPITGIDQAIMLLGRETLYRWLAVSIFRTGGDGARDVALLEVALARARLLELSALSTGSKPMADELFLVGLLSFIDSLLGVPMKDVLASMSLPPAVRDVLLDSQGPHVPWLMLAIAVEKCHASRAEQLAQSLSLTMEGLNLHRDAALVWAEEAARQ